MTWPTDDALDAIDVTLLSGQERMLLEAVRAARAALVETLNYIARHAPVEEEVFARWSRALGDALEERPIRGDGDAASNSRAMSTWPTREEIIVMLQDHRPRWGLSLADAILARFEPWRLAQDVECATHGCQFTTVAKERGAALAALESLRTEGVAIAAALIQERDAALVALEAARSDLALALPLARAALDCYEGRMLAPIVEIVERMTPDEWARLRGA